MAITNITEINDISNRIKNRGAFLYHACQLKDFKSYLELGGVPSRNKLHESGLDFTEFETDYIDKKNSVWDKVFGNFSDFGKNFPREKTKSMPNPYGPIQIVFDPLVLKSVTDISITLRSAGAKDFHRDNECLKSSAEIEKIYAHINPEDTTKDYEKAYIAFSEDLNSRFKKNNCTSPEFNCAIENELLSFNEAIHIIVDNCEYQGSALINEIKELIKTKELTKIKVFERKYYCNIKKTIINELSKIALDKDCSWKNIINNKDASNELKEWVKNCNEFHYNRFIKYLTLGTIRA
ncbi:hypothetical protein [Comamonas guangdongensis]|uniref:DUF4433 domain-containing protein n=1 Tax=Comamonas guangdongensis TaxID=510515 RepID=A0ABV3ZXT2_9BURK